MSELIEIDKSPVKETLRQLLKDKTTGKNIIFATDMYSDYGYTELNPMTEVAILGFDSCDIQPRVRKAQAEQNLRTRKKAEVFTPTWICNMMNNHCDSDWFGREDVFNYTDIENRWYSTSERITFPEGKTWQQYVDSRRLEITCGEAPYLVSRYDTTTGAIIPIKERIGMLDRKMRVINENAVDEAEWLIWTERAFNSVYGYEFQGDNLLIARINLLVSFCDYLRERWEREATKAEIQKLANIISWNLWQMDGLSDTVPVGIPEDNFRQMTLFDGDEEEAPSVDCKIYDWRKDRSKIFKKIKDKTERGVNMKFDYVIGNPPYQDNTLGENDTFAPPIYNAFMDAAYEVADKVELIHPARFLFNAGSTPKAWNQKMLNDEHFKVLYYEQDSSKVFSNTDIKGGIAVSYRNKEQIYGAIEVFTPHLILSKISNRLSSLLQESNISHIIHTQNRFNLENLYADHPEYKSCIGSEGKDKRFRNNTFEKVPVFLEEAEADDDVKVIGVIKNKRNWRYINKRYVDIENENLYKYKVIVPRANGTGTLGEVLSSPIVLAPNEGYTQTFIGIGAFSTIDEAENTLKYIKTKFARAMLGILKIDQHNEKDTWKKVPLQNFTPESDIDWSVSIAEIDKQLYKKYNLTQEEIDFIESHVKEMS